MKCGHHQSLSINSAETGAYLYCDLCDAKGGRADAEQQERDLQWRVQVLRAAIQKFIDEPDAANKLRAALEATND
jgi:hypothetical protein